MANETAKIEAVYYGLHDDMVAEVSAWSPRQIGVKARECKYLVMAYGNVNFDTDWTGSKEEAFALAREIARFHGVKIHRV